MSHHIEILTKKSNADNASVQQPIRVYNIDDSLQKNELEQIAAVMANPLVEEVAIDAPVLRAPSSRCIWTQGIQEIELPVAHGEGKFVASQQENEQLSDRKMIALQYSDTSGNYTMEFPTNPNGSLYGIAGICNQDGNVFGLMPHPERYLAPEQHPHWTLQRIQGKLPKEGAGLHIFRNGIEYCRRRV